MRLEKIQNYLTEKNRIFEYHEEDGLGSVDFDYRGISYHIWEFEEDGILGVESNVRNGGYQEEFTGDYETTVIDIMKHWK